MTTEIERKFLVIDANCVNDVQGETIRQGYITSKGEALLPEGIVEDAITRVRVKGEDAFLTIKGKTIGITRLEFEYNIPVTDANLMLESLCGDIISKTRYSIDVDGLEWVVDVFDGDNQGLIVAEVELEDESQSFTKPAWAGEEVSHDNRYFNSYLSKHPYTTWPKEGDKNLTK